MTEEAALAQLRKGYRGSGIEVRFYPDCCTIMRWEVGRNGDGQHFTLIAYGSTPGSAVGMPFKNQPDSAALSPSAVSDAE